MTVVPEFVKMTSPLATCPLMLNWVLVCGRKFDHLKNEKKTKEYRATMVRLCSRVEEIEMIFQL